MKLLSLKFISMYLYSVRHYRHISITLEPIPFDKLI